MDPHRKQLTAALFSFALLWTACAPPTEEPITDVPTSLGQVPAVGLNYRYEADVPPPTEPATANLEERSPAVQADFDQNRTQEILDKTFVSPNGQRVAALYHRLGDMPSEFRLDMYDSTGALLNRMTADMMAVHFPDTIRWSPDSQNLAFVAMIRGAQNSPETTATPPDLSTPSDSDVTVDPEANAGDANSTLPVSTPAPPKGILIFRTEQIYLSNADASTVKPITQTDGLIYFYYKWSPDSSALAALAATQREWQFLQFRAETNGEIFVPLGRPRLVERNGRERRLDDGLTAVHPVWSPDSTKVACAYDTQVRIYDANVSSPTQAAIPLRNQLLISAQAYDRQQQQTLEANVNSNENPQAIETNTNQQVSTLPDEKSLVSFNPIVALAWSENGILYFQTAFIKRMKKEIDSVTSFQRWHRLILTPQPAATK